MSFLGLLRDSRETEISEPIIFPPQYFKICDPRRVKQSGRRQNRDIMSQCCLRKAKAMSESKLRRVNRANILSTHLLVPRLCFLISFF